MTTKAKDKAKTTAAAAATTPKAKPKAEPISPAPQPPGGKLAAVIALLSQPDGTTIEALMSVTGWQIHSVRGALAGAVKKKGHTVISEKTESGRVYRIEKAA